ncbi:Nitrogen regulatory protein P-II [hydrothermal vent metagenome]|uniref:Nitrogen regulatory protein P-II n=1 Tax=hydrothermal vent metagenome TaxID=652676 RepID=A0A3B0TE88_9ZZZZ
MKEIKAYIQPFMLQEVTNALHKIHVRGMSVNDIRGFGKEKDEGYPHHAKGDVTEYTPKIKIEIACYDEEVDAIVDCIREHAHTGRKGDGKIFVNPIECVTSIRTGEKDRDAI